MSSLRPYRVVHYPATGQCLLKTVHLAWHWDWRYGKDPVAECRRAAEEGQTLDARAETIVSEINAEILTGLVAPGRRWGVLEQADLLGAHDRDLLRRDLLTVQVAVAMLSAMAAKAVLEQFRPK